ncbi:MAG: plasminogen-binding N-terminal domain-containing protein [Campylobacterales bacterium]
MIRAFGLLFGLYLTLFANSSAPFGEAFALPVSKKDGQFVYMNAADLKIGETGSIIRWFDTNHSAVVAKAVVVDIDDGEAKLLYRKYDALKNDAFPTAVLEPKRGDEVHMRSFNKRALLVAPDQEMYQKLTKTYDTIDWIHPDIFVSEIIKEGTIRPDRDDFRDFCSAYSVGVVYFVNGTKGEARDCSSFEILKSDYISGLVAKDKRMKPLYSRIGNIEAGWLSFLNNDIGDFYTYYRNLLETKEVDRKKSILEQAEDMLDSLF